MRYPILQRFPGLLFWLSACLANAQTFTSSTLPIVSVQTNGQTIADNPKITATLNVTDKGAGQRNYLTDQPNHFNATTGQISISIRGNSSQNLPKKSYSLETQTNKGKNLNFALLGLPADNDWVLYASYTDRTLMRDPFTYYLARKMGRYSSRARFVELLINGDYQGVYVLEEKIKQGSNRVAIKKTGSAGDTLTGGYILKIDSPVGSISYRWASSYINPCRTSARTGFEIEYPKASDLQEAQKQYIQQYVSSFEDALSSPQFADPVNGYARYADVDSFVDYFLLTEFTKNQDAYRLSTYFYKDRDSQGGKLTMGPFWDENLTFGNAPGGYCGGQSARGWAYQDVLPCTLTGDGLTLPFWWNRLLEDPGFVAKTQQRWTALRQVGLDTTTMFHYIDSVATVVNEAQVRNFQKWPILTTTIDGGYEPHGGSYGGEITYLKNWIRQRVTYMDANMSRVGHFLQPIPAILCRADTSVTLTAPTGRKVSYGTWQRNGQSLDGQQSEQLKATQTGVYSVAFNVIGDLTCPVTLGSLTVTAAPSLTATYAVTADASNQLTLRLQTAPVSGAAQWKGPANFQATGNQPTRPVTATGIDGLYSVTATGPGGCRQTTTVTVAVASQLADLSMAMVVEKRTSRVGEPVGVTLVVTNASPTTVSGVVLQNRLPTGLAFVSGTSVTANNDVITTNGLTIPAGNQVRIAYTVQATAPGTYLNAAQVWQAGLVDPDSRPGSGTGDGEDDLAVADLRTSDPAPGYFSSPNPDQYPIPAVLSSQPAPDPAKADLSLDLIVNELTPIAGDTILISLKVSNAGGQTATAISLGVTLPAGWRFVSSAGFSSANELVTGTVASLPALAQTTLTFKAVTATAGLKKLAAEIKQATPADSDSHPNSGTLDGEDDMASLWVRVR